MGFVIVILIGLVGWYALLVPFIFSIKSGDDQDGLKLILYACLVGAGLATLFTIFTIWDAEGEDLMLATFFLGVVILFVAIPASLVGAHTSRVLYKINDRDARYFVLLFMFSTALLFNAFLILDFLLKVFGQ